eukprot:34680_6
MKKAATDPEKKEWRKMQSSRMLIRRQTIRRRQQRRVWDGPGRQLGLPRWPQSPCLQRGQRQHGVRPTRESQWRTGCRLFRGRRWPWRGDPGRCVSSFRPRSARRRCSFL